ncbi:unnamed protein product [Lasius platythorax]|uniref:Aldehyde dehydrogenase domain-containing protein n=1 Tax=Lasius platythorax TaxID=488582 RepID=A0AAV2P8P3_9HYME
MHQCVKTINEYYTNLEYKGNRKEAQEKISNLCKELKFKDTDDFSHRFLHTASLIKENLNLFMSFCEHVDVITTIIDYFVYYGMRSKLENAFAENNTTVMLIMLTICNLHQDYRMQLFFETAIIKESEMQIYNNYKKNIILQVEIILLEDSDLHAVINCLKFRSVVKVLSNIWIQESITQTFMWYFKKYFGHILNLPIHRFQSTQELLTLNTSKCNVDKENVLNIVSIWSEDVTVAKNLAESLNQHVVFINTCMDFDLGITFPYLDLNSKFDYSLNVYPVEEYTNPINPTAYPDVILYDLFYDGVWQIPIRNTYWMHNNILLANATREDIMNCANSAVDGFKTWSTMSSKSRMQVLANFAAILECNGKFILASTVLNWVKFSYICESQTYYCIQSERFEISKIYMPQGTVILKEKDENTLFQELTQSLIIGNSVIVICNPDLCLLAPYCNMFKMSGIPPGVINLLSRENTDLFIYDKFRNTTIHGIYSDLTTAKYIIVSR